MEIGGDELYLPCEIMINILKRLPVKSIVRFQGVCQDWKKLFKTPSFIAEHLRHTDRKNPLLLLDEYSFHDRRSSLCLLDHKMETVGFFITPSNWSVIGSCNGLLCVTIYLYGDGFPLSLCLWNPTIREVREIPQTTNDYCFCLFGFGFSSILNDYKIVKFYNQELRKKKEIDRYCHFAKQGIDRYYHLAKQRHDGVEIYSLSTDSWKELEFEALQNITFKHTTASVDGIMVWLGEKDSCPVLVSFDIVTEVFTITALLSVGGYFPVSLDVYNDKFAIFWRSYGHNSLVVRVMELVASEFGKSLRCTEQYIFDTSSTAVCIWGNEIVFVDFECETDEPDDVPVYFLNLFNLTTKKWKEFRKFPPAHDCYAGFNYGRSLVSVWNTQVE